MLRRFALVLMLFTGLVLVPLARAAQPCCEHGGCEQAMPACVAVCALCASPAALPAVEPGVPVAGPARIGPVALAFSFDDWAAEIWNPPD